MKIPFHFKRIEITDPLISYILKERFDVYFNDDIYLVAYSQSDANLFVTALNDAYSKGYETAQKEQNK